MIKLFDHPGLRPPLQGGEFIPWDIYSARVLAAYCSYYDMQECQFWVQDHPGPAGHPSTGGELSAAISLVDGFAVLAAKESADWEELVAFLTMQPWSRLQCDAETAEKLPFPVEWRSMLLRFAAPKKELAQENITAANDPGVVYDILTRCGLGAKNRNEWMADLALRWRRGTAQTWLLNDVCTGSAMAVTPGHVYIGALGTLPEHRGRGLAGRLVAHICGQYAGREIRLSCREELRGFYENIGFERVGEMSTMGKL